MTGALSGSNGGRRRAGARGLMEYPKIAARPRATTGRMQQDRNKVSVVNARGNVKKLNGWKRVGVVLSVLWMPVGLLMGSSEAIDNATWLIGATLESCLKADGSDWAKCNATYGKAWPGAVAQSHHWLWGIAGAIIPVVICWLLAWALVAIVRWVIAGGFKSS